MFYREILRPILFLLPAETVHRLAMALLKAIGAIPGATRFLRGLLGSRDSAVAVRAFGIDFPSPIGLAAGMDKDAETYEVFGALGFGFVEVGTLTARPQEGNPKPRLFRLPADRALINRMGFNNRGAESANRRLSKRAYRNTVLGINIGKTKVVPEDQAVDDYLQSAKLLLPFADYLVVNVSSPNTPGLRDLQAVERLKPLLSGVQALIQNTTERTARRVPLLVKIAPDLSNQEIDAIADLALELKLDGIIATNTTINRDGLISDARAIQRCGAGGLSGAPLKRRSLEILRRLRVRVGDRLVLIGVGGIRSVDDVWEWIVAGATLVQLYTALVYDGPLVPYRLAKGLARRVRSSGLHNISQAVGIRASER
jgi:dihydroorotate dehydrogenase